MENRLIPTEQDVKRLRQEVATLERQQEWRQLANQLQASRTEAQQEQMLSNGEMQMPDTYHVLKTKGRTHNFVELMIGRLVSMVSFRPIIGNIIALGLALVALYYINHVVDLMGFAKYRLYFERGIMIFGAIQLIKSGSRSLLLPLIAMIWGGMAAHTLGPHDLLFTYGKTFYEYLTIAGIIGVGMAVLTID